MALDTSLMDTIIANSAKRHGETRIHRGDQIDKIFRLPFDDSIELFLATWGGAPMGKMMRPWGGKSSCKSMIAWQVAKTGINIRNDRWPDGMTVGYHSIEGAYDPYYVKHQLGIDITKVHVFEDSLIEDVSENLDSSLHALNIHIIDSASFAQSIHAFEAKKDSRQPGFNSQAWGKTYMSAEKNMSKQENLIIIIDQVRTDFKTGAEKAAGGNVPDHASSMSLRHRRATKLYRRDGVLTDKRPDKGNDLLTGTHRIDGYEVEIEVDKSRVCRPFGKARLRFDIDKLAFDRTFELAKAGIWLGVINVSGAHYSVPTMQKSIHGGPKLRQRIEEDGILQSMIWDAAQRYIEDQGYGNS